MFLCPASFPPLFSFSHGHLYLPSLLPPRQDAVLARWAKERKRALKAANKAASPDAPAPPYCFALVEVGN